MLEIKADIFGNINQFTSNFSYYQNALKKKRIRRRKEGRKKERKGLSSVYVADFRHGEKEEEGSLAVQSLHT